MRTPKRPTRWKRAPLSMRGSRTGRDRDRRGGRVDRARGGRSANQPEEAEFIDWDRISPDKKMRLRDGFEFDKKFVNENIDNSGSCLRSNRELTACVQQFPRCSGPSRSEGAVPCPGSPAGHRQRTGGDPLEPDPPVYDPSNPVGFLEQQAEYQKAVVYRNRKIDEFRQLQWAHAQQAQANQQQQAVQTKAYIAEQQQALFTAIPRLRDKSEREKFHADYVQLARIWASPHTVRRSTIASCMADPPWMGLVPQA